MALRRDQELCYHCEDKWVLDHRCKPRLHLFIADDDIEPFVADSDTHSLHTTNMEPPDPDPDPIPIPHISLNAMEGTVMPGTFRLYGLLCHHRLVIFGWRRKYSQLHPDMRCHVSPLAGFSDKHPSCHGRWQQHLGLRHHFTIGIFVHSRLYVYHWPFPFT